MWTGLISVLSAAAAANGLGASPGKDIAVVVVEAGRHERVDTPVMVPASARAPWGQVVPPSGAAQKAFELLEERQGASSKPLLAQWQAPTDPPTKASGGGALIFTLAGKTPAGSVRRFRLRVADQPASAKDMRVEDDKGKALLFRHAGRSIAKYNYGLVQKQPGKPNVFDRMAYFHPVWAPCGQIITDDFPESHPHQRGVFFAWTRARIGKYKADFWNLKARRGRTLHKRLDGVGAGPAFSGFVAYNDCVANNRVAIKETWVSRIYARPVGPWILDFDIRHTATDQDVVLAKYPYGGMAYRGRPEWLGAKRPRIEASDGYDARKGRTEGARWVDMAGVLPTGGEAGLTMIDHPSNPTYPTAVRIHPSMPYVCFAFAQRDAYTIKAGESLELRYRCVVHDGPPDRKLNDRWAADFVDPPKVTLEPVGKAK